MTTWDAKSGSLLFCFNPHTHEGCDWQQLKAVSIKILVSIHTPTKGVTWITKGPTRLKESFNPHTHEGCDFSEVVAKPIVRGFNPHTHEGCDSTDLLTFSCDFCFNPHTHEGCDYVARRFFAGKGVSIHTPTKGVTVWRWVCRASWFVSIHTPTKGVTNFCFAFCYRFTVSIHTPTKGVT